MVYAPHRYGIASGVHSQAAGAGGEIWQVGIAFEGDGTLMELAEAFGGAFRSWFGSAESLCDGEATVQTFRVQNINSDGNVVGSAMYDPGDIPGPQQPTMPSLCSIALTWETGVREVSGRRIRGRIYPPNGTAGFLGSALTQGANLNYARSGARLITRLQGAGLTPVVASQTGGGQNVPINGCSCDNLIDTQRRRKNDLISVRDSQSVPYNG